MSFILKQFEIGPMQNFGYLIGDEKTKQAFIVDPAWEADTILKRVASEGYQLAGFLVTHAHYDHVNAIDDLLKKVDVPVYANKAELEYAGIGLPIVGKLGRTARGVDGGEIVKLGETDVCFLHTPGHTPGSQCIRVGNQLLTGDTLFVGGCGRSDLPGGDAATLYKSLKKISELPPELEFLPGHDYGEAARRTLGDEKKTNPYLNLRDESSFVDAVG